MFFAKSNLVINYLENLIMKLIINYFKYGQF